MFDWMRARYMVCQAFEIAECCNVEMTIVCYINGYIKPWMHYPSMIPTTERLFPR